MWTMATQKVDKEGVQLGRQPEVLNTESADYNLPTKGTAKLVTSETGEKGDG